MSQIEIPKVRENCENINTKNLQRNQPTRLNSKITVIKAGVTQYYSKQGTPSSQHNNSSSKLTRINSSKGISVVSRPTSSEKRINQFSTTDVNSRTTMPQSQTSIKSQKDQQRNIMLQMRHQLTRINQIYEDKMKKQLSMQYNLMNIQIERLKQLLNQGQARIIKQEIQIRQLNERIQKIQNKTQTRVNRLQQQLSNFRLFYDQCFDYSMWRVNDIDNRMGCLFNIVQSETKAQINFSIRSKFQLGYQMIKGIAVKYGAKMSQFKIKTNDELFEMELMLGQSTHKLQSLLEQFNDLKGIDFGNKSLQETVKYVSDIYKNQSPVINDHKNNDSSLVLQDYDYKFKQILKKVNSATMQIQLIKSAENARNIEQINKMQQKFIIQKSQLKGQITIITQKMKAQEQVYKNQIQQYSQQIKKLNQQIQKIKNTKNPQIQKLEQLLQKQYNTQSDLKVEICQLNKKIAYYQVKCERSSQLQISLQTSLAEAYSESMVKDRMKVFENQKQELTNKIKQLQAKIEKLDHENYLLAEKLVNSSSQSTKIKKTQKELQYLQKQNFNLINQIQNLKDQLDKKETKMKDQQDSYKQQIKEEKKKVIKIQGDLKKKQIQLNNKNKQIIQLKAENQASKEQINELELQRDKLQVQIRRKLQFSKSKKQQNQYNQKQLLDHIQTLEGELDEYQQQIENLKTQNAKLEANLQEYATTFEKQSITFRDAINKLQNDKDHLALEVTNLVKENTELRYNSECQSTGQSFFQNNSMFAPKLRKTCSTQLSTQKSMKKFELAKNISNKPIDINKIHKLKNIILKLGYEMPALCQVDATGNLKHESSGMYLIDEDENLFQLSQEQLSTAVTHGIILL